MPWGIKEAALCNYYVILELSNHAAENERYERATCPTHFYSAISINQG